MLRAGDFCQAPGSGLEPGAGSFSSWFLALDSFRSDASVSGY